MKIYFLGKAIEHFTIKSFQPFWCIRYVYTHSHYIFTLYAAEFNLVKINIYLAFNQIKQNTSQARLICYFQLRKKSFHPNFQCLIILFREIFSPIGLVCVRNSTPLFIRLQFFQPTQNCRCTDLYMLLHCHVIVQIKLNSTNGTAIKNVAVAQSGIKPFC